MWQFRIEIEYYSDTYFEHITEFDALQHVKLGNALKLCDGKILNFYQGLSRIHVCVHEISFTVCTVTL